MDSLMEVLEEVNRLDYMEYDTSPVHHFSRRSRKAMNRLLASTVQTEMQSGAGLRNKIRIRIQVKKRIVIILVMILLAAGVTAGASAIYGFRQDKHREYTILRTVNAENCPKTIETVFYLTEIPEGYEFYKEDSTDWNIYMVYMDSGTNLHFSYEQAVKDGYKHYFDTEQQDFEELDIDGYPALYLDFSDSTYVGGLIVWDNGEYIFKIFGNFTEYELIKLAKSVKSDFF